MKVIDIIESRFNCEVIAIHTKSRIFDGLLYSKDIIDDNVNVFSDEISAGDTEFKFSYIADTRLNIEEYRFLEEILPSVLESELPYINITDKFASLSVAAHSASKLDELIGDMAKTLIDYGLFKKVAILLFNGEKEELRFTTLADISDLSDEVISKFKSIRIPASEVAIKSSNFDSIKYSYSKCGSECDELGYLVYPLVNDRKIYGLIIAAGDEHINLKLRHTLSCTARFVTAMLAATILYKKYNIALASEGRLNKLVLENATLLTLGKYTANIVHEIKNPLISIGGFAKRLMKATSDPNLQKMARIITTEAERLERLTSDILSYSNKHEVVKTPLNLLEEMLAIQMLFETRSSESNIEIILSIQENLSINVDHSQFRQVMVNLVANAMNAVESNGSVTISTFKRGNYYEIAIIDTGEGISDENISKIFKPFFTTSAKGTGLGLAISKKIMKNHGGDIVVKRNDIGTTFILFVPVI